MRHFYLLLGTFLSLSLGLKAQNYTAEEMLEIQTNQQSINLNISNPFQSTFSTPTYSTDNSMTNWIPTAGATQTFIPEIGDLFFDPGGPGGGADNAPGNYPNCGCTTQTTLEGVSTIRINEMDIFANFDYIRIYDGTDATGNLLYGNGQGDPNDGDYGLIPGTILNANSGNFFFYFHASSVVNRLGWEIQIMDPDGEYDDPFPAPYCPVSGISTIEPITRVIFADIDNSSSASPSSPAHEDFTHIIGNVEAGGTYPIAVEGYTGGNFTNSVRVYIDWNQDGDFTDDNEYYYIGTIVNSTGTDGKQATLDIEVPENALEGNTRMRVIKRYTNSDPNPNNGCVSGSSYAQAEDYTLQITNTDTPTEEDCSQGIQSFSTIPNAFGIKASDVYRVAEDFFVEEGTTFTMTTITIDMNQQEVPDYVEITIYENNNGQPGNVIETIITSPDSSEIVGSAFGDPIHHLTFNLDSPLELEAGTYWLSPIMSTPSGEDVWWAATDLATHGVPALASNTSGAFWTQNSENLHMIFTVSGICEGDDTSEYDCEIDYEGSHDNGLGNLQAILYANDFVIQPGVSMSIENLTLDILGDYTNASTLSIYENLGGQPGAVIESFSNLAPISKTNIGSAFDFNIYRSVFEFPTAVELESGTYWIGLQVTIGTEGTNNYWATSDSNHGFSPHYSQDGGNTWTQSSFNEDCAFIISGTCLGEPEPVEGCLWTVNVSDNFFGDEVSWELRDQITGNILLTGGNYGLIYNDTKTVIAEGPVEFFISSEGFLGDNTPSYSVSNENGVIVSGTLPGNTNQTFSNINCDDLPPPPPNLTCEDNFVDSNNLENGSFFAGNTNQRLATDVIVGDEGFTVYGMELNIFTDGNTDLDFYFTIYENSTEDLPGNIFNENGYGSVHSSEFIGQAFGYDFYRYFVYFDSPVELEANSIYWIEVESNSIGWETTEVNTLGSGLAFNNTSTSGEWVKNNIDDLVYSLICEELDVVDLNSFDFAYYPNPVKDILNITSMKNIEKVAVYNLTGQEVLRSAKLNQGQIDLSNLSSGTYVFRVTLDDGQVETFKIIKR